MKKAILLTGLMLLHIAGASPFYSRPTILIEAQTPINPLLSLFKAVCIVESANDPLAFNIQENAVGIAQIRPIRLADYNQRTGEHYTIDQMYSQEISKKIWMYYAMLYNVNDLETIARAWNGSGEKTIKYWNKVKKHIR